jgi:hypothetical protein
MVLKRIQHLALLIACACLLASPAMGQGRTTEPIYRVAKAKQSHPLAPALKMAYEGLADMNANLKDYTAVLVKRERIDGVLGEQEFAEIKIRNRRVEGGRTVTPLSVYMKFLKPAGIAGRECIWVEGRNDGKLVGHEAGWKNVIRANLKPDHFLAMRGNKYPITHIGVVNMIEKLIEKGERDAAQPADETKVQFFKGAKINGRTCTLLQVTHEKPDPKYDFYLAQIFIDDELNVPIRYASWEWPATAGGKPVLQEEYTYMDFKANVGLTEADFDADNPNYNFP